MLDVVRERGAFLIEDDWAHDFGIDAASTPVAARDDSGHVVYLRSLTKSVSPAIRVAGLIARGPARDRILADSQATTMYVSGTLQAAALDVVTQPAWCTHLRAPGHQLGERRDLLIRSLLDHVTPAHLDTVPKGGLNLWLQLPETADLGRVVRQGAIVLLAWAFCPRTPRTLLPPISLRVHVRTCVMGRSGEGEEELLHRSLVVVVDAVW